MANCKELGWVISPPHSRWVSINRGKPATSPQHSKNGHLNNIVVKFKAAITIIHLAAELWYMQFFMTTWWQHNINEPLRYEWRNQICCRISDIHGLFLPLLHTMRHRRNPLCWITTYVGDSIYDPAFVHYTVHVLIQTSKIRFVRPFKKRTHYAVAMSVRPSILLSVRPSSHPSFTDFLSTCFEKLIWHLIYTFSGWHDMSSFSSIAIRTLWLAHRYPLYTFWQTFRFAQMYYFRNHFVRFWFSKDFRAASFYMFWDIDLKFNICI